MKSHKHESCSNLTDAFRTFIGCTVKGCLFNALPVGRADLAHGTKTLIFDCGWGLTIASNGSYWPESPEEIKRAIRRAKEQLRNTQAEIKGVLQIAGA